MRSPALNVDGWNLPPVSIFAHIHLVIQARREFPGTDWSDQFLSVREPTYKDILFRTRLSLTFEK